MMALLAAIEVFDMLEAENGDGPYLPTGRGMTNHYHTFHISVKCHFSTTFPCSPSQNMGLGADDGESDVPRHPFL
jgi:hypothetical protein